MPCRSVCAPNVLGSMIRAPYQFLYVVCSFPTHSAEQQTSGPFLILRLAAKDHKCRHAKERK